MRRVHPELQLTFYTSAKGACHLSGYNSGAKNGFSIFKWLKKNQKKNDVKIT